MKTESLAFRIAPEHAATLRKEIERRRDGLAMSQLIREIIAEWVRGKQQGVDQKKTIRRTAQQPV